MLRRLRMRTTTTMNCNCYYCCCTKSHSYGGGDGGGSFFFVRVLSLRRRWSPRPRYCVLASRRKRCSRCRRRTLRRCRRCHHRTTKRNRMIARVDGDRVDVDGVYRPRVRRLPRPRSPHRVPGPHPPHRVPRHGDGDDGAFFFLGPHNRCCCCYCCRIWDAFCARRRQRPPSQADSIEVAGGAPC